MTFCIRPEKGTEDAVQVPTTPTFCKRPEPGGDAIKVPSTPPPSTPVAMDLLNEDLLEKIITALDEKMESLTEECCQRQEELMRKNVLPLIERHSSEASGVAPLRDMDVQTDSDHRDMSTQTAFDYESVFSDMSGGETSGGETSHSHHSHLDHHHMGVEVSKSSQSLTATTNGSDGEENNSPDISDEEEERIDETPKANKRKKKPRKVCTALSDETIASKPDPSKELSWQESGDSDGIRDTPQSKKSRRSPKGKRKMSDDIAFGKEGTTEVVDFGDLTGKRTMQQKMDEVALRWVFKKYPVLSDFLKHTTGPFSGLVKTRGFKGTMNLLVFSNIIFIVIQAEAAVTAAKAGKDSGGAYVVLDMAFTIFFACDLILRLIGERASYFYTDDKWWNVLDFCLVMGDLLNEIAGALLNMPQSNFASLRGAARAARAARVARTLRIFRSVSFFTLPREVVAAFTAVPFMMILWFFISLFFSLIFVQAAVESLSKGKDMSESQEQMILYFGSVKASLTSLFFVFLGGLDWAIMYHAFEDTGPIYAYLFLGFAFFAIVAFMNSITAMCVQSCFARVLKNEMEGKVSASVKLAKTLMKTAEKEFANPLAGRAKYVCSWSHLNRMLDHPLVHGQLEALGIDLSDAQGICKLMASNSNMPANMQDFARACVKFTRSVKGVDFVPVLLYNKQVLTECRELCHVVHQLRRANKKVLSSPKSRGGGLF